MEDLEDISSSEEQSSETNKAIYCDSQLEESANDVKDQSIIFSETSTAPRHEEIEQKNLQLKEANDQFKFQMDDLDPLEQIGGSEMAESDKERYRIAGSPFWTQSIAPGKFYKRIRTGTQIGTSALTELQQQFEHNVLEFIQMAKPQSSQDESAQPVNAHGRGSHHLYTLEKETSSSCSSSDDDSSSSSSKSSYERTKNRIRLKRRKKRTKGHSHSGPEKKSSLAQKEILRKRNHPAVLHPDLGYNEPGQLNDGPHCKCSWTAKQTGIRHDKFVGEKPAEKCDWNSSNVDHLHHYVLMVEPSPSKISHRATSIRLDGHVYEFDGFSVFFHRSLPEEFPQQPINQWTDEYRVRLVRENMPESFTIHDLELFHTFLFEHVLELYDLNRSITNLTNQTGENSSCHFWHCFPRFARKLPDDGKELLPMSSVLSHFVREFTPLVDDRINKQAGKDQSIPIPRKGQICLNPTKHPKAMRVDLIDSYHADKTDQHVYPLLIHFGVKPTAYAFSKRPQYQDALKKHIKFRKELFSRSKAPTAEEKQFLWESEANLQQLKQESISKREVTVRVSSRGFYATGLYPDIVQHALLLVLMCHHIRFHCSLGVLETERIYYVFKNRGLLELALIHPSFRTNYGTNPDHAKNTLNNCGLRIGGDKRRSNNNGSRGEQRNSVISAVTPPTSNVTVPQQQQSTRKRGIQALMEIMSLQGSKQTAESPLKHNERLEFLGDAVVEFLTTIHLFFLFTDLDEGGLATFRSALVQNRHLATLADRIGLQQFMVYAHGPDLCHETDLRHAMANAFEAMMAAIFLDSNLEECDRIFSNILFKEDTFLKSIWMTLPEHPLKRSNPFGDRHLIERVPSLKLLSEFEQSIGIRFKHIRLLAKAFTRRNVPYNYLTLGNNQRLEFLGDTVLQLLTTEYLYKHFPHHQEGHLSLLRTCLVSNKTQAVVCDELAMSRYLVIPQVLLRKGPQGQLRLKDKADLNEAFLGALYVDRGLIYCRQFCRACFFPRLKYFIMTQRWNDPKSQLQQCCLTLREGGNGNPDIPEYKTIGIEGPTNTRVYRVAVYFRNKRLSDGVGHSVHQAQMQAAENALEKHSQIFPSFNTNRQQNDQTVEGVGTNSDKPPIKNEFKDPENEINDEEETDKSPRKMIYTNGHYHKTVRNHEQYFETPNFSNSKLNNKYRDQRRERGEKRKREALEDEDEEVRHSPPKAKRGLTSAREQQQNSLLTRRSFEDKSYVSPRLVAIHKVMLKCNQLTKGKFAQQKFAGSNKRTPANGLKLNNISDANQQLISGPSNFFFNNPTTTPRYRPNPAPVSRSSPAVDQQPSNNGYNLALLPPPPPPPLPELPSPPPPPSLSSTDSRQNSLQQNNSLSMPFVLIPPPPPPPKMP